MERITLTVTEDLDNIRVDRFLRKKYSHLNQGQLENFLKKGLIKLNNKKCKSNERVKFEDEISIASFILESIKDSKKENFSPKISNQMIEDFEKMVIFENSDLIAINKINGLATQGGSNITKSVDKIALEYAKIKGFECAKLVHRIDKETSGILIIAISEAAAMFLTKAFRDKVIEKEYLAIVKGKPRKPQGEIKSQIQKSITYYKIIDHAAMEFSLLSLKPVTGRKHQLRMDCANHLKNEILNDSKYGTYRFGENHLNLHAYRMKIPALNGRDEIEIIAKLPNHFASNLNDLGLNES